MLVNLFELMRTLQHIAYVFDGVQLGLFVQVWDVDLFGLHRNRYCELHL